MANTATRLIQQHHRRADRRPADRGLVRPPPRHRSGQPGQRRL